MTAAWQPRFEDGSVSAVAASPIAGGTFVVLTGSNIQGEEYQVATCGLGASPFSVTVQGVTPLQLADPSPDGANSVEQRVWVYRGRGIARVQPGAAISGPGVGIQSDALGRAIPAGAPVAASLTTGVVANANALTWVAVSTGTGGNSITVAITNPGGTVAAEVVTVTDDAISVAGRTNGGVLTSTANDIIAAIEASTGASALVSVASATGSSGLGVVVPFSSTDLAGGASSGGSSTAIGISCCACDADDPFVEIALY